MSEALDPRRIDLVAVHNALRTGRATDAWLASFMPSTWSNRKAFRDGLYAEAGGRIKSRPETGFDIYADVVLAHLGRRRTALVTEKSGPAGFPFEVVHERSSALASTWSRAGVVAGDSIAIVLPMGLDYVVSVVTALRMGLVATPLEPRGPSYVRTRLEKVGPKHVVTTSRYRGMLALDAAEPLAPNPSAGDTTWAASHTFASDEPALALLSPFGDLDADPVELTAGELHEALLRDGFLVWTLEDADRIAAPGFDPVQLQPITVLSAWIRGSAWVEIDLAEIRADAKLLKRLGVTVLGVDVALREHLLAAGPDACAGVRSWFRSLNDVFDYSRWADLTRMLVDRDITAFAVLTNAASGGAHLFAPRTRSLQPSRVWPVPGRAWQISQVGAGTLPAINESGMYTPFRGEEADESLVRVVVAKVGQAWMLGGTIDAGPQGRTYPAREVAKAAERHPAVRAAAAIVAPGRFTNDAHIVLLAFVDGVRGPDGVIDPAVRVEEVSRLIAREMGELHVPERIEVLALRPRFVEGEVDLAWCRSQYLSGALTTKVRMPLFTTLSRLGWIFGSAEEEESE